MGQDFQWSNAWHVKDPVFIIGQTLGILVYSRKLRNLKNLLQSDASLPPPNNFIISYAARNLMLINKKAHHKERL